MDWPKVSISIDQLVRSSAVCFKGHGLQELSSTIVSLADQTAVNKHVAGRGIVKLSFQSTCKLPLLLSQLLSVRRRARDWKQPEYSSRVCSVLRASVAVMQLDGSKYAKSWMTHITRTDTLSRVNLAQQEVAQLLTAQLQQHKQGEQQLQQLQDLAQLLLSWWVVTITMLDHKATPGAAPSQTACMQHCCTVLNLAAVLAQSLTADSNTQDFVTVARVTYKVQTMLLSAQMHDNQRLITGAEAAPLLQLSLALLLLHSYSIQQVVGTCSSSSTSSSSSGDRDGSGSSGSTIRGSGGSRDRGSQMAAQLTSTAGCTHDQQQKLSQEQQQQLDAVRLQLWQAAGLSASALPAFAAAVDAALPDLITDQLMALKYEAHSHPADINLPALRAFMLMTDVITLSLQACGYDRASLSVITPSAAGCPSEYKRTRGALLTLNDLSRQQQMLLQAVVWLLPQFLLQMPLLCSSFSSAGTQLVARTATPVWWCLTIWLMSGLHESASVAAANCDSSAAAALKAERQAKKAAPAVQQAGAITAAAGSTVQPLPQLLGPLLDARLLLMQQQLVVLLPEAAANTQLLPAGSLQSQQLSTSKVCSCCPHSHNPIQEMQFSRSRDETSSGDSSTVPSSEASPSLACAQLSCDMLYTTSRLIMLLQLLSRFGDVPVWRSRLPRILLLLEGITRRLLPLTVFCNTSGSSSASSSSSTTTTMGEVPGTQWGHLSSGGMHLSEQVRETVFLLCQDCQDTWCTPGPITRTLMDPSMDPHAQESLQQLFFALLVSQTKLSMPEPTAKRLFSYTVTVYEVAAPLLSAVFAAQGILLLTGSLAEVRALLSPWVAVLGISLRQLGLCLQLLLVDATHAAAMTEEGCMAVLGTMGVVLNAVRVMQDTAQTSSEHWSGSGRNNSHKGAELSSSSSNGGAATPGRDVRADVLPAWDQVAQQHTLALASRMQQEQQGTGDHAAAGLAAAVSMLPVYGDLQHQFALVTSEHSVQLVSEAYQLASDALKSSESLQKAAAAGATEADDDSDDDLSSSSSVCSCYDCVERRQQVADERASTSSSTLLGTSDSTCDCKALSKAISAASSIAECLQVLRQASQLQALPSLLQAAGTALCNKVAVPWRCNNLGCTNMAGVSELQLVGGSSCVCGYCRVARYCSRACQAAHWQQHKAVCRDLVAAAAAVEQD